jgi:hypothetical protein
MKDERKFERRVINGGAKAGAEKWRGAGKWGLEAMIDRAVTEQAGLPIGNILLE